MNKVSNINLSELALLADINTLTITPNNRTAACLSNRVIEHVLSQTNKNACVAPTILPLDTWVSSTFLSLRTQNIAPFCNLSMIGDNELTAYWVKAIHNDKMAGSLVNLSEWLSDAMSADKILSRWEVTKYQPDSSLSSAFMRWRANVQKEILTKGFVTKPMAIELLINAIKKGEVKLPKRVALYAFDEQPPLYKKLFAAIQDKAKLNTVNLVATSKNWYSVPTVDNDDQLTVVAKWASKIIDNEPGKTIAIVSHDLKANRNEIVRSLNDVFEPQWLLPSNKPYIAPYDVSLGLTLKQIPLYQRALHYLSITSEFVMTEHVLNIITDPFIVNSKTEKMARRKFASKMRDNRAHRTSLMQLAMKSYCPSILSRCLNEFVRINTTHPDKLLPSRWARLFNSSLNALGWARGVELSEMEALGADKWKSVLDSLSSLDMHTGEITRELAYKLINQYCQNTLVTPKSKNSPISVMGSLEAAGLNFDYIWIIDCVDNIFPAPASLNGCIPTQLQIDKKMPHSSGEREYEFTQMLFNRYASSCSRFYTSYTLNGPYGAHKPASILSNANSIIDSKSIIDNDVIDYHTLTFQQFNVKTKEDNIGKLEMKNNTVPGGVSLVDKIGLCMMQAITNFRMKVTDHTPNYNMGFTGAEKGIMLHNALESLWGSLIALRGKNKSDSYTLEVIDENKLAKLIANAVDIAFFWVDRTDIREVLIEQERSLMCETLSQWISLERDRDEFNIIALEKSDFIDLGGVKLKIRKDRVDHVFNSDNTHKTLALDAKSREESVSRSFGRNPKSQLPLAAISEDTDGFGYLNVVPNSPSISGLINCNETTYFKSVATHRYKASNDWATLKEHWLKLFSENINSYVNGDMKYTPSSEACMYCVKRSLCEHSVA